MYFKRVLLEILSWVEWLEMPEISHPGDHADCYLATTAQDDRLHWELMSVDQSCQR